MSRFALSLPRIRAAIQHARPLPAVEPELVVCPTCLGTGRDPEAPAAIADDDGTCPCCCDPQHRLYAARHGYVLQD